MHTPDIAKQLRELRRVTGKNIAVPMFAKVDKVVVSDDRCAVRLEVHEFADRPHDYIISNKGTRTYLFARNDAGKWECDVFTTWDEPGEFAEVVIGKLYRRTTPADWLAALEFARDCHRPGSSAQPMDSYERVLQGDTSPSLASTEKMARHW